jgi:hypothetical protein
MDRDGKEREGGVPLEAGIKRTPEVWGGRGPGDWRWVGGTLGEVKVFDSVPYGNSQETPSREMAQNFHALQETLPAPSSPALVNGISYRRQSPSNRSKQVKCHAQCLHSNDSAGDSLCLTDKERCWGYHSFFSCFVII